MWEKVRNDKDRRIKIYKERESDWSKIEKIDNKRDNKKLSKRYEKIYRETKNRTKISFNEGAIKEKRWNDKGKAWEKY